MSTSFLPLNIQSYKNDSVINIYCERYGSDLQNADEIFKDTIEFLWTSAIGSKTLSPSKEIDDMWHVFILHTKDYETFCKEQLGKFVHHTPCSMSAKVNCTSTAGE
jgi:hypothetical protein